MFSRASETVRTRGRCAHWIQQHCADVVRFDDAGRASLPNVGVRGDGRLPGCVAYGSSDVLSTHEVANVAVDVEEIRQCRSKFHPLAEKKLCDLRIWGRHWRRLRVFSFIAIVVCG